MLKPRRKTSPYLARELSIPAIRTLLKRPIQMSQMIRPSNILPEPPWVACTSLLCLHGAQVADGALEHQVDGYPSYLIAYLRHLILRMGKRSNVPITTILSIFVPECGRCTQLRLAW